MLLLLLIFSVNCSKIPSLYYTSLYNFISLYINGEISLTSLEKYSIEMYHNEEALSLINSVIIKFFRENDDVAFKDDLIHLKTIEIFKINSFLDTKLKEEDPNGSFFELLLAEGPFQFLGRYNEHRVVLSLLKNLRTLSAWIFGKNDQIRRRVIRFMQSFPALRGFINLDQIGPILFKCLVIGKAYDGQKGDQLLKGQENLLKEWAFNFFYLEINEELLKELPFLALKCAIIEKQELGRIQIKSREELEDFVKRPVRELFLTTESLSQICFVTAVMMYRAKLEGIGHFPIEAQMKDASILYNKFFSILKNQTYSSVERDAKEIISQLLEITVLYNTFYASPMFLEANLNACLDLVLQIYRFLEFYLGYEDDLFNFSETLSLVAFSGLDKYIGFALEQFAQKYFIGDLTGNHIYINLILEICMTATNERALKLIELINFPASIIEDNKFWINLNFISKKLRLVVIPKLALNGTAPPTPIIPNIPSQGNLKAIPIVFNPLLQNIFPRLLIDRNNILSISGTDLPKNFLIVSDDSTCHLIYIVKRTFFQTSILFPNCQVEAGNVILIFRLKTPINRIINTVMEILLDILKSMR